MKTKVIDKKLSLNKKTVVNLEQKTMQGIYGGATERTDCFSNCASDCFRCMTITRCSDCCIP
jgi:hypothetical protein